MWLGSGGLVAFARGTRIRLLLFQGALFENHFELSPKASALSPLCQEPRPAEQRRGQSAEAISEPSF